MKDTNGQLLAVQPYTLRSAGKSALNGLQNGGKVILNFLKYIIPAVALIKFLDYTGIVVLIAAWCEPAMALLGLPGKAAIVLFMGQLSLYSGIAAMGTLAMTAKQITICSVFLGSFHAILLESIIVKRTGGSITLVTLFRLMAAILSALVIKWVL